jgi:energy-coupling factor transporter ATP-binding protein EcfA2
MTQRLKTEPGTLPSSADQVGGAGKKAESSRVEPSHWPTNPFVGLRPFEASEGLLFFGRRDQTMELLERLHKTRFLSVVGSSGCGKSSLIRAGLIPKLIAGFLVEERDRWMIATMKPGDAPLEKLAASVLEAIGEEQSAASINEFVEAIRVSGAQGVTGRIAPSLRSGDTNILLLIDQFEEIFRFGLHTDNQGQRDEAADFVSILLALAKQRALPIYVVITMRSDFLGDCDNFYGLPEAMNRSQYLVPRLTRKQRQEAIEGPVRLFGSSISPRLLDRLLNDVGEEADQLPVLQHALMRTWENWEQTKEGPIDLANYEAVGTLKDALSNDADKALDGVSDEEMSITQRMFQALTDRDERGRRIRRPARLSDIQAITGASRERVLEMVERFEGGGRSFLNLSEDKLDGDSVIDISHESLIRQWRRLGDWVDQEAESRTTYLRVVDTAVRHKEKKAKLWGNPDLQIALDWREKVKPNKAWAARYHPEFDTAMTFLDKSKWSRIRKIVIACAIILISAGLLVKAQYDEAQKDARIAREDRERERHEKEEALDKVKDLSEQTADFLQGKSGVFEFTHPVVGEIDLGWIPDGDIAVTREWIVENIVVVDIPELKDIPGGENISFHKGFVDKLKAVFQDIQKSKLMDHVLTVDYAYVSPTDPIVQTLKKTNGISPHSLGIAIDINKKYNPLDHPAATKNEKGTTFALVPIFERNGFDWGGTLNGGHFEIRPPAEPDQ